MSKTVELRNLYPPVYGVMRPENMPGYRAPRVHSDLQQDDPTGPVTSDAPSSVDLAIVPLLTSIMMDRSGGHEFCLQVVPIVTGYLSTKEQLTLRHVPLYNHEIPVYAAEVTAFSFAIYGFNSGHFVVHRGSSPFQVALVADTRPYRRALFKQFTGCPIIADLADGLL